MTAANRPSCTLCLIAKNEGRYLLEWVAYHRLLGFDQIVIYDNDSDDDTAALLAPLQQHGLLERRLWSLGANESPQTTAYADALARSQTDWMLFIDADEFLVLQQHDSVADFLAPHHADSGIGVVALNWRLFGDNGLTGHDPRPVTERFQMAAALDFPVQHHVKCFVRVAQVQKPVRIHLWHSQGRAVHPSGRALETTELQGQSRAIEFSVAQLNHYYGKTLEEYQHKAARGRGGAGQNRPEVKYHYAEHKFRAHNQNRLPDTSIQRMSALLQRELARLRTLTAS
ncbi:MAG TPA: glycosyltransferase family 2 protein [Ideonella sp.]|uniref:glycosyltransferase family 2 protein n=1 Tax=Ideonella sp. TaxID=1929293 RepID=UPI002D067933|nr:glycosyltransferase family 2 protein [Ideonella sp.]HSI46892.1 glycosyltransferase family 2 protein [Ideonella sp.]